MAAALLVGLAGGACGGATGPGAEEAKAACRIMTEADNFFSTSGTDKIKVENFADRADIALQHARAAEAADSQWDSLATNIRIELEETQFALGRKSGHYDEDLDLRAARERRQQCKDAVE